jgi:CBS domain-containing protein
VHTWTLASLGEAYTPGHIRETRVEDYMNTDLMTVHQQESVEFVACMMDWQRLRHVLIEDENHHLVGIISHRRLLRHMAERDGTESDDTPIGSIMKENPISVTPDMPTLDAVRMMREKQIGALPVVREGQLVGIITEREFMDVAHNLLNDNDAEGDDAESEDTPDIAIAGDAAKSVSEG